MLEHAPIPIGTFLLALDLAGTFIFALSGAMAGVRYRLDFFGVLVLSVAAATAGGMTRDALIGATPVAAIDDWRYIAVSLVAGLITFRWSWLIDRLSSPVLVLDGAGLALFAVTGSLKALAYHLNPVAAVLLGVLTAVGGGVVRDVLTSQVPVVLRSDLYAVAALAGAMVVVLGRLLLLPTPPLAVAGVALCFVLRILAIRHRWSLPVAPERR